MNAINNLIAAITFLATSEGLAIGPPVYPRPAAATGGERASTGIAQRILSRFSTILSSAT